MHNAFYTVNLEIIYGLLQLGEWLNPNYFMNGVRIIDFPDKSGRTPLFLAAMTEQEELMKLLVRNGSQTIDIPDGNDITPLECTIICGSKKTVRLLKILGASWRGSTAIDELTTRINILIDKYEGLLEEPQVVVRDRAIKLVLKPIDDEHSFTIRQRVYFNDSLTSRLLNYLHFSS